MNQRLEREKPNIPIAEVLLIILLAFIMLSIVYTPSKVKGRSMLPTIEEGDIVMVSNEKIRYNDIVTARPLNVRIIKRVMGLPGDTLEFKVNQSEPHYVDFYRNGKLVEEGYINERMLESKFGGYSKVELGEEFTLEDGYYFLMGDNRNFSEDSREIGAVHKSKISGVVGTVFKKDSFMAGLINYLYKPEE